MPGLLARSFADSRGFFVVVVATANAERRVWRVWRLQRAATFIDPFDFIALRSRFSELKEGRF